jgi:hypothetical protein
MSTAVATKTALPFPESDLIDVIEHWWADQAGFLPGSPDPFADAKNSTVFDFQPEMDSLRSVLVLVELECHLPFELPVDLIQIGGYESSQEMIDHLIPQLGGLWVDHCSREGI